MKAMKAAAKPMTKRAIAEALAASSGLKKAVCSKAMDSLAKIATKEVGKTGVFSLPGLCRFKTRTKPATKAGERDLRQDGDGEGKAREEDGEGFPGGRPEEEHLSRELLVLVRFQLERLGYAAQFPVAPLLVGTLRRW